MTFAVDTSVVTKLYFAEDRTELARALFADAQQSGELVVAPHLLASEFVNVTHRKMRREGIELPDAVAALDGFLALPIRYVSDAEVYRQALLLTEHYSLSGFDAQYVALAQLVGCELWVDDERMLTAISGRLPFVRRLAEYRPRRPTRPSRD